MRRFEFAEGKSSKFWECEVRGSALFVRWGRLGTSGREQTKELDSTEAAVKEATKLIAEKLKKGYQEISDGPAQAMPFAATPAKPAPQVSTARFGVEVVVKRGAHRGLVLGLAVQGKQVVAVGGQGRDLVLLSKDGKSFRSANTGGRGLRGALIASSGDIFVAGEYGYVAVSRDKGKSWERIRRKPRAGVKGEAPCLFGIVEDEEGAVWTCGDNGFLGRLVPGGYQVEPVAGINEYMARIRSTPLGLLVPTDPGHLFLVKGEAVTKLKLNAKAELMMATVTPAGTIVVVGLQGAIHRSTNQGKKFEKIAPPEPVMLTGIDCLQDGRLLVVGDKGTILVSTDDGQSFTRVKHGSKGTLWCCRAFGDGALIGGEEGQILRYGPE